MFNKSLTLVSTSEMKIDNFINTIQENELCVSLGQYQEMSRYQEMSASGTGNIHEEKKSSEVVNSCNEFPAVSRGEERRYFCLEDIPNCSVGDDDVFYPGNGMEEQPRLTERRSVIKTEQRERNKKDCVIYAIQFVLFMILDVLFCVVQTG